MLIVEKSAVLALSVLILLGTNVNYTVYHLYMGQKKEFSTRLLNKLHFQLGVIGQVGTVANFLLLLKGLEWIDIPYIYEIRHFQVPLIVFTFLEISIAHNIKLYSSDLYLDLGQRISNWRLLSEMICFRYIFTSLILL